MTSRQPRLFDEGYLAWLRQQPCVCGCGSPPPSDAAHLRAGSVLHDKPITGMGRKPDDRWALPLKHEHHMAQHAFGDEVLWFAAHGIDPFKLATRLYKQYGGTGGTARGPRKLKPRKPRKDRTKIKSRPNQWAKGRKFEQ